MSAVAQQMLLAFAVRETIPASAVLAANAALSATVRLRLRAAATLEGGATLSLNAIRRINVTAVLAGNASLDLDAFLQGKIPASAVLAGNATLAAATTHLVAHVGTALLSGGSTLAAATAQRWAASAVLAASSALLVSPAGLRQSVTAVLAASHTLRATGTSGGTATRTFLAATGDTADLTTYTFAGQNLGTASADRIIVVAIAGREGDGGANRTLSSVTVAGISATIIANSGNVPTHTDIAVAAVPTGTSGSIVVTYSGQVSRCVIGTWATTGMSASSTSADASDTSDPYSASVDVPAGGVAFGISYDNGNTTFTWTGLTEDSDAVYEGRTVSFASAAFASQQTGLAVQADAATDSGVGRAGFASFGPT